MITPLNRMIVRPRPWLDVLIFWTVAPSLSFLTLFFAYFGQFLPAFAFLLVTIQAVIPLNIAYDTGPPLTQYELDALMEKVSLVICDELYTRENNPLSEGGRLSVFIESAHRFQKPAVKATVRIPTQINWIGVSHIAQGVVDQHMSKRKLAATSRRLKAREYEIQLDAPSSHDRIEASARRIRTGA
tara:strand:+ start:1226 stop:1783 length:558 start_codon:yes stop_codon:yes gene_type:complete